MTVHSVVFFLRIKEVTGLSDKKKKVYTSDSDSLKVLGHVTVAG